MPGGQCSQMCGFRACLASRESELQAAGRLMVARKRLTRMILNQAEKDANRANELETRLSVGTGRDINIRSRDAVCHDISVSSHVI